jgi:glucosamine--fructose-6-phosphate aminotransferase (isomerizing)
MCGILGVVLHPDSRVSADSVESIVKALYLLSETRGKEASGFALTSGRTIKVGKRPIAASKLIKDRRFNEILRASLEQRSTSGSYALIGHSRLVTNGAQEVFDNNQPIVSNGAVGIHNGIIVNDADIWRDHADLSRKFEVDTEVFLAVLSKELSSTGDLFAAAARTFDQIKGTASVAVMFEVLDQLLLATNNGSLYVLRSPKSKLIVFASEYYILSRLLESGGVGEVLSDAVIEQIVAGKGKAICLRTLEASDFSFENGRHEALKAVRPAGDKIFTIEVQPPEAESLGAAKRAPVREVPAATFAGLVKSFDAIKSWTATLRRCTKCVLPETMPFIAFDARGVCNYCNHYRPMSLKGEAALHEFVATLPRHKGKPDCIVTFSGGRDSSYGLHYLKKELGLTPIAYSYDWGMITDLGRRNQARMCGQLGVEHILVSADITKKRENIRKNVAAWLKKPDLGTIPLFMAGDKQYFYYANELMKHTGINTVAFCANPLEKTDFKSGYCGVKPNFSDKSVYKLSLAAKVQMAMYYAKRFLINPAFINSSLFDTVFAFSSYYVMDHQFLSLFDYIRWDEDKINETLLGEYDWEVATDTKSTWRIGDGTAAFYNYIYYAVSGFTENDTFRSNQIREGMLTREAALKKIELDNQPRYDSLQWYCRVIGIDFLEAMQVIHQIPRLSAPSLLRAGRPALAAP